MTLQVGVTFVGGVARQAYIYAFSICNATQAKPTISKPGTTVPVLRGPFKHPVFIIFCYWNSAREIGKALRQMSLLSTPILILQIRHCFP